MTVNYENSRINMEKLPLPIQMELSEKQKFVCQIKFKLNFKQFEENEPHHLNISEVIDSKRRAYLNA